jgi:hypothetical protein
VRAHALELGRSQSEIPASRPSGHGHARWVNRKGGIGEGGHEEGFDIVDRLREGRSGPLA